MSEPSTDGARSAAEIDQIIPVICARVIGPLFEAGIALSTLAALDGTGRRTEILDLVPEVDELIARVRKVILGLAQDPSISG